MSFKGFDKKFFVQILMFIFDLDLMFIFSTKKKKRNKGGLNNGVQARLF